MAMGVDAIAINVTKTKRANLKKKRSRKRWFERIKLEFYNNLLSFERSFI